MHGYGVGNLLFLNRENHGPSVQTSIEEVLK